MNDDHLQLTRMNRAQFGALVERYRPEIRAHCYRMMGTIQDAEDMTQEAFLNAWRRRETYAGRASFRAWLYKIATNVCLDALKKLARRAVPVTRAPAAAASEPVPAPVREPVWLEPYPDELLLAGAPGPEAHYLARETIALAFIAALHLLPPRQRATLLLRDVLEWPAREVAEALDTTVPAVKSMLHRARATLADHAHPAAAQSTLPLDGPAQAQLEAYVRAWEQADVDGLVALLTAEASFSMPPTPSWYRGRAAIHTLASMTFLSGEARGRWRLRPTRANRQPAFALYRHAGDGRYTAYGIQLLTPDESGIADVTSFNNAALFAHFGLPAELEQAPR